MFGVPEKFLRISERDANERVCDVFTSYKAYTNTAVTLSHTYQVPKDKWFHITQWWATWEAGASQTGSIFDFNVRNPDNIAEIYKVAYTSGVVSQKGFYPSALGICDLWVPPDHVVNVIMTFSAGTNANWLYVLLSGYLLSRSLFTKL